jgi:hypothetical protein
MVFSTEAIQSLRLSLGAQVDEGTLSEAEAVRRMREADPDDPAAIMFLLDAAMTARRYAEAERFGWELLRTAPTSPHSYLMIATVLEKRRQRSTLSLQFLILGLEMLQHDEDELEDFDLDELVGPDLRGLIAGLSKRHAVHVAISAMRQVAGKAADTTAEAAPYRHILTLRDLRAMERSEVDAILRDGAQVASLLRGVLRQYADGELDGEIGVVERAIGLLGEIGDPATIPDLSGFYTDDELVNPAMWAFWRISSRRPVESFEVIRSLAADAEPLERFVAANHLVHLPPIEGRVEVMASLLDGIEDVPREQRSGVLSAVLSGLYVMDGADSPAAAALEQRYARLLTKKVRKQVEQIRDARRSTGPEEPPGFETNIYDICCTLPKFPDVPF